MGFEGDQGPNLKWLGETLSKYDLYSKKKRKEGKKPLASVKHGWNIHFHPTR